MQNPQNGVHRVPFLATCSTWSFILFFSAEPNKGCESENHCMKDKSYCLRGECHCKNEDDVGDGKTYCNSKYKNSCNKTLSGVLKNVNDQYFSSLVNLSCFNNIELKLSSLEGRTSQKSKLLVAEPAPAQRGRSYV